MEEKQAADQDQGVGEIKEEETREELSKREAPDRGLRRSRRLGRRPRRKYSDIVLGNTLDFDGENFLALAFFHGVRGSVLHDEDRWGDFHGTPKVQLGEKSFGGTRQRPVEGVHGRGTQGSVGEGNLEGRITTEMYSAREDAIRFRKSRLRQMARSSDTNRG